MTARACSNSPDDPVCFVLTAFARFTYASRIPQVLSVVIVAAGVVIVEASFNKQSAIILVISA